MAPKTRNQFSTDGSNDNNNFANVNGGNDTIEGNTVNPNRRIPRGSQLNGSEIESLDLIQQFARVLNDPESDTARALIAMFKVAVAQNQSTVKVPVNVDVNPGQSSGLANLTTEVPSSQVFDNPTFETIFTGANRIPIGNQSSGQNQSFYQSIPTTIPIVPNPYNIGIGGHPQQVYTNPTFEPRPSPTRPMDFCQSVPKTSGSNGIGSQCGNGQNENIPIGFNVPPGFGTSQSQYVPPMAQYTSNTKAPEPFVNC